MKKYARIAILLLLSGLHIVWIMDTGTHYMDDVITIGGLFYPQILPYSLLAAALSFLLGNSKVEKGCALVLFMLIAVALFQVVSIKVDGDRWHLLSRIHRHFQPRHSFAPWLFIGLCFQQTLATIWKRRNYFSRWLIPLAGFLLAYVLLAYAYIVSLISSGSSLLDAILVLCLGSLLFGLLWTMIFRLYNTSAMILLYGMNNSGQQRGAHVREPHDGFRAGGP